MTENNGQPQGPMQIPPQPVPTIFGFDHTTDGSHVVMVISHPSGQHISFLSPENVEPIVKELLRHKEEAARAKLDLSVNRPTLLGPDGAPVAVPVSPDVEEHMRKLVAEAHNEATPACMEDVTPDVGEPFLCARERDHDGPHAPTP